MRCRLLPLVLGLVPLPALATPGDEIQVYTGGIMPVGEIGLTWHNNYTINGAKAPDFPGALPNHHAYAAVTEWALGVTDWFEAGLYLPLYSHTPGAGFQYDGFKLRALFVQPGNEEKNFYYGVNFEFSWNEPQWDAQTNTGEIRPIIGWRFGDGWSFTLNPILDNSYKGFNRLTFAPAMRLDKALNERWTVALESYSEMGELRNFHPADQQSHQLWLVGDYSGDPLTVEFGVGAGLTPASDSLAVKLMLISDLTGPHGLFR
jgi:hypothetical protein